LSDSGKETETVGILPRRVPTGRHDRDRDRRDQHPRRRRRRRSPIDVVGPSASRA